MNTLSSSVVSAMALYMDPVCRVITSPTTDQRLCGLLVGNKRERGVLLTAEVKRSSSRRLPRRFLLLKLTEGRVTARAIDILKVILRLLLAHTGAPSDMPKFLQRGQTTKAGISFSLEGIGWAISDWASISNRYKAAVQTHVGSRLMLVYS